MKSFAEYINEASGKPMKGFIEGREMFIAYKLNPETYSGPAREMELHKLVWQISTKRAEDWDTWKKGHIDAKRKKYKSAVNAWAKSNPHAEYILSARAQTPSYSDDSLEVYYRD